MNKLAQDICTQLRDYHNYDGFYFTPKHVIKWVSQFDPDDQVFILEEFLHLLNKGIYISEARARELLLSIIKKLAKHYKFTAVSDFLKNVEFLRLQPKGKSQAVLLDMLGRLLTETYGIDIVDCGTKSKKYALYIDDILATGNSVFKDLKKWLILKDGSDILNVDSVISGNRVLIVYVFCLHAWSYEKVGWRLKNELSKNGIENKISYWCDYTIENHPTKLNQKLNFAYPIETQPKEVIDYVDELPKKIPWKMTGRSFAMRKANNPVNENFFSSPQNRIRFENILLNEGIKILKKISDLNYNQRPMGNINPTYQTLGLGTLFFTWRNISNTSPIVFWWKVNWQFLFPLINRGN